MPTGIGSSLCEERVAMFALGYMWVGSAWVVIILAGWVAVREFVKAVK